jgi:hypothetical protein
MTYWNGEPMIIDLNDPPHRRQQDAGGYYTTLPASLRGPKAEGLTIREALSILAAAAPKPIVAITPPVHIPRCSICRRDDCGGDHACE